MSDEPWTLAALDAEELFLAHVAELHGAGYAPAEIARILHVGVGLVLDVLGFKTKGPH